MSSSILNYFIKKKPDQGFTLIELLVVVIIIGILSAIALPQTLNIIGRGREAEARSMMGAMNRAQQTFFKEKATFATSAEELEVPVGNEKYYQVFVDGDNDETEGRQGAFGINKASNGTRDYAAAVGYDQVNRTFSTVVCRSIDQANQYGITGLAPTDPTLGTGTVAGAMVTTNAQCDTTLPVEELR
ncbi:MAG: type IV pilin-like G/H family protein [Cyanobacteria bacterium P01_G01_bin.49]